MILGAELKPGVISKKLKEVSIVSLVGFFAPILECAAIARHVLNWNPQASLLCGLALSTTSMAVVYAVMLETGSSRTDFGKGILGACFVNDLGFVRLLTPYHHSGAIFLLSRSGYCECCGPDTYSRIRFSAASSSAETGTAGRSTTPGKWLERRRIMTHVATV
jgi:hypothetical protein